MRRLSDEERRAEEREMIESRRRDFQRRAERQRERMERVLAAVSKRVGDR